MDIWQSILKINNMTGKSPEEIISIYDKWSEKQDGTLRELINDIYGEDVINSLPKEKIELYEHLFKQEDDLSEFLEQNEIDKRKECAKKIHQTANIIEVLDNKAKYFTLVHFLDCEEKSFVLSNMDTTKMLGVMQSWLFTLYQDILKTIPKDNHKKYLEKSLAFQKKQFFKFLIK